MRAKAVLLRDLEELRSERIAAENPPEQVVEPVRGPSPEVEVPVESANAEESQPTPQAYIKEEKPDATEEPSAIQDPQKEEIAKIPDPPKEGQVPSPPSSNDAKGKPDSDGLDVNTTAPAATATPPTGTSGLEDPTIDSLFDLHDSNDNNNNPDLTFDGMDFLNDASMQDTSQTQNTDFELSTFGNNLQDFNMTDAQGSNLTQNTNTGAENPEDDLFGMINAAGGDELMDLDASNIRPAEETAFDDMFFGDDGGLSGNQEMTDEFDDAFFGIT